MEKNNNTAAQGPYVPPENSSSSSSASATTATTGAPDEQEESGWTDYLEDYFNNSEIDEKESSLNYLCSSIGSCSNNNISYSNYDIINNNIKIGKLNNYNNLSLKKTRTQKIFEDDDSLRDTATSPIHSPKVDDLKVRTSHENPRFDDPITIITNSMGRGRQLGKYYSNKENDVYSSDKNGLCLFPLSMLLNYHN